VEIPRSGSVSAIDVRSLVLRLVLTVVCARQTVERLYSEMLQWLGVLPGDSYNVLFDFGWVLLVPRGAETDEGIAHNSLAFSGHLLVKTTADLERLRREGPLQSLRAVASEL